MRAVFGFLVMVVGVIFGLWAGGWWAFVGGIVDVIEAFKQPSIQSVQVAWGIFKFLFAIPIGWVAFAVVFLPGYAIFTD